MGDSRNRDFDNRLGPGALRKKKKGLSFHSEFGIVEGNDLANPLDDVHGEKFEREGTPGSDGLE